MVVKPIAGVIGIAIIAGVLFAFKDNITEFLNRDKQQTPEEIEQTKKRNERGALANTQAFIFGEQSLEPSKVPPQLGILSNETVRKLSIPKRAETVQDEKGTIFSVKRFPKVFGGKIKSITAINKVPFKNIPIPEVDVMVDETLPSDRETNIIGKNQRTNKELKVTKRVGGFVVNQTLVETTPTERKSNVVPIGRRRQSTFNRVDRLPVEQNSTQIQKIEEGLIIG